MIFESKLKKWEQNNQDYPIVTDKTDKARINDTRDTPFVGFVSSHFPVEFSSIVTEDNFLYDLM